jgi:hypothetical protein
MWDVILGYWVGGGIFGEDIKMTEPHLWAVKVVEIFWRV